MRCRGRHPQGAVVSPLPLRHARRGQFSDMARPWQITTLAVLASARGFQPSPSLQPMRFAGRPTISTGRRATDRLDALRPTVSMLASSKHALLLGGATVSRQVGEPVHEPAYRSLPEFLRSEASTPALLGAGSDAVSYRRLSNGRYECEMPPIGMLAVTILPVLTVSLERNYTASSLRVLVESASIYIQTPGVAEAQLLQGAIIDSSNTLDWAAADAGGHDLQTRLEMRVAVKLPPGLPLPRAAVERPGSAVLRRVCDEQCRLFLATVESAWRAWREAPDEAWAPARMDAAATASRSEADDELSPTSLRVEGSSLR